MDYSKRNTDKELGKIRSGVRKSRKKVSFNILRFTVIAFILAAVIGVSAGLGAFMGIIDSAPELNLNAIVPSKVKSTMYYSDGSVAVELAGSESNRTIISIDDMPDYLPYAFAAIEDERFYEHNGIDPIGIARAFLVGLTSGDFSQGASTITQQLIKLTIFEGGGESDQVSRFERKFQEWYLALQLEELLTKDEIMETYLNTINLGRGAYGVEAAAERYFDKTCSELTISECAVLAAIAQSPSYNNPIDGQEVNSARRDIVLENMLDLGFITEEQYDEAASDDVYSRIQEVNEEKTTTTVYTWFEDAAITQVLSDLQTELGYTATEASNALYSGGLQIYLTQDKDIQEIVDSVYLDDSNFTSTEYLLSWALSYYDSYGELHNIDENSMASYYGKTAGDLLYSSTEAGAEAVEAYKEDMGITDDDILAESLSFTVQVQSSFVLMDQSNGHVVALAGGRGEKTTNRGFNRATQATRQPGSTFKILACYAPLLDTCGLTLASTKVDEPYTTPSGTEIHNTSNTYRGTVTAREAITRSMNIVTTKFYIEDVTPHLAIQYLLNMGFTTISEEYDGYDTLALGGIYEGVSNFELTAAYAAIANGGIYTEPILYTKITDSSGNVLIENVPETRRIMSEETAWLLTSAMQDVVSASGGTGLDTRISNTGIAQAGKTGTTSDYKDLWFVGYTPYYTAGVWLGYDNSVTMRGRISSSYTDHKYIWKKIMEQVHEGYDDASFGVPDGIVKATVCEESGLLVSGDACTPITEYFSSGTVPTEYCESHIEVAICSVCGLLATPDTPEEYIEYRVFSSSSEIPEEYCQHVSEPEPEPEPEPAPAETAGNTQNETSQGGTSGGDTSQGDAGASSGGSSSSGTTDDTGG